MLFKDKSFVVSLSIFVSAVLMVLLSLVFGSIGYGKDLAFYSLAAIILVSAIGVVTTKNLVHAGFMLVLTFVTISGLYMLLNADFLAAAQILINGGAVTIMIIFAVMLTNSKVDTANEPYSFEYRTVAFILSGLGLFFVLFLRLLDLNFSFQNFVPSVTNITPSSWNIKEPVSMFTTDKIGQLFFGQYLVPFEIASIILLMALIGAIVLALRDSDIVETNYEQEPVDVYDTNQAQTFPVTSTKK